MMSDDVERLIANLTANQRLVIQGRDLDIVNRRARTRARNDVRALRLMWSEGQDFTPLGEQVRAFLVPVSVSIPADAERDLDVARDFHRELTAALEGAR